MTNQLTPIDEVRGTITRMKPEFAKALPKHVTVDKFERVVMTSIQKNPDLLTADRRSLFMAATQAAAMGLLPDGREGAIVMYGKQAQFLSMVAGVMKLARLSGEIASWSVQVVYENDAFDYQLGDDEFIRHKPVLVNRGKLVAAYSIVKLTSGETSREVMTADEIAHVRKKSKSSNGGPWQSDEAEMWRKSVTRRHAKRLPSSTDHEGAYDDPDDINTWPDDSQAPAAPAEPRKPGRPTRLQAVVDTARAPTPAVDDDGVIDMPTTSQPDDTDPPI